MPGEREGEGRGAAALAEGALSDCEVAVHDGQDDASARGEHELPKVAKMCKADFLFLAELGEGSFSTVYLASERSTHREFAIKMCDKKQIVRERKVSQIYREKEALARLSERDHRHPFIIQIYCTFQDPQSLYIVMTYAKGGELLKKLKRLKTFSLDATRFYISEIVAALGHMHRLKIIHRDLKPENVLLSAEGHILISDFGSAKILDAKNSETDRPDEFRGRKRCSSFVGTAQYVSPEVLNGEQVQQACDYWAVGVMIYQFLTGKFAFHDASEYLIYQKIVKASFQLPENFPPPAGDLVRKFLVVDARQRLGSIESGGVDAVMRHPFFDGVPFEDIQNVQPPRLDAEL